MKRGYPSRAPRCPHAHLALASPADLSNQANELWQRSPSVRAATWVQHGCCTQHRRRVIANSRAQSAPESQRCSGHRFCRPRSAADWRFARQLAPAAKAIRRKASLKSERLHHVRRRGHSAAILARQTYIEVFRSKDVKVEQTRYRLLREQAAITAQR